MIIPFVFLLMNNWWNRCAHDSYFLVNEWNSELLCLHCLKYEIHGKGDYNSSNRWIYVLDNRYITYTYKYKDFTLP